MIYVLCIYNKKEKEHQITVRIQYMQSNHPTNFLLHFSLLFVWPHITNIFDSQMGAYEIEDAMAWKKKIELIIDQVC
jgi:hypothetical protein